MPNAIPVLPAFIALSETNDVITAETTVAQIAFIDSTAVLIANAITNGLFMVQPYMVPLVTSDFITSYFTNLSYVVLFPIIPYGSLNNCYPVAGFPEVYPTNWVNWACGCGNQCGPQRIQISWGP